MIDILARLLGATVWAVLLAAYAFGVPLVVGALVVVAFVGFGP